MLDIMIGQPEAAA